MPRRTRSECNGRSRGRRSACSVHCNGKNLQQKRCANFGPTRPQPNCLTLRANPLFAESCNGYFVILWQLQQQSVTTSLAAKKGKRATRAQRRSRPPAFFCARARAHSAPAFLTRLLPPHSPWLSSGQFSKAWHRCPASLEPSTLQCFIRTEK